MAKDGGDGGEGEEGEEKKKKIIINYNLLITSIKNYKIIIN